MTQPNLEVVGVRAVVQGFDAYVRQTAQVQRSTTAMARGVATAGKQAGTAGASFRKFATSAGAMASGLLGVQIGLASVRAAFGGTVGAAIAFESSFAGVRKTVDATEEQFAVLESGFRSMSKEIPVTVFELNRIGEAAGQLGIETENIIKFTETMAQLGATTNLSAEQAATALARLANITQLPQDQFDELGSTIVDLGNNFATTEAEIVDLSLRLAAAGSQIGLTQAEILGFATALSSVGIRSEAAGTAFSRVFVEIEKAVRSGGEKLEIFAATAGLSAEQFRKAYAEDAAGAIVTFVEGLGAIGDAGGNVFDVLEGLELNTIRIQRALVSSAGAGDLLREALDTGAKAWKENTALQVEFAKRAETSAAQFQVLRNRITDMGITVGTELVPPLLQGTTAFVGWIEALRALEPILPSIAVAITALVGALVAGKLLAFASGITTMTAAARAAVVANGPLILFAAAVVAIDLALRQFTGAGLLERLAGNTNKVSVATKIANEELLKFRSRLAVAGDEAELVEQAQISLARAVDRYTEAQERANGATAVTEGSLSEVQRVLKAMDSEMAGAIETVEQLSAELIAQDASARDLVDIYNDLPPALRDAFLSTDQYRLLLAELTNETANAVGAEELLLFQIRGIIPVAEEAADSMKALADNTFDTAEEALRAIGPLGELEASLREIAGLQVGKPLEDLTAVLISDADALDLINRFGKLGEDSADALGDGLRSGGGGGGVRKAVEEIAQDAIGAFMGILTATANRRKLEKEFGKTGAAVADAFLRAIIEPTERAGETLGRAIQALFDEAEAEGVVLSEEAGRALMDALALGIDEGSPEATRAALDAIRGITDALDDGARTAVEIFRDTLSEIAQDETLDRLFGQKGSDLFDALTEGMESGSERAIASAARQGMAIRDILEESLGRRQGKALGDALMDALEQALVTGGGEALAAVRAILAEINTELAGVAGFTGGDVDDRGRMAGAIDPSAFSEDLRDLASDLGLKINAANLQQLALILAGGGTPIVDPRTGRIGRIPPGAPAPAPAPDPGLVITGGTFGIDPVPLLPPPRRGGFIAPETIAPPSRRGLAPGDKGDTNVAIDLSGSTFTGTAEENGDAIAGAVHDILAEEQTVGAFQAGVS